MSRNQTLFFIVLLLNGFGTCPPYAPQSAASGQELPRLEKTSTDQEAASPALKDPSSRKVAADPFVKTYQRWISQIVQDSASNIVKEFWPDINRAFFHNKY